MYVCVCVCISSFIFGYIRIAILFYNQDGYQLVLSITL